MTGKNGGIQYPGMGSDKGSYFMKNKLINNPVILPTFAPSCANTPIFPLMS
jgi:hypothetical protein